MMRGFYNGVLGIKTQSVGMDVWSNNISNINNAGFRASRPEYKTVFDQTVYAAGNNPTTDQVGLGATVQTTALNMNTGSFQATENKFDFAIQGDGFFGVNDRHGHTYYTRAGNFDVDAAGNLVDNYGNFVQGTMNTLSPVTPSTVAMKQYGSTGATTPAYTVTNQSPLKMAGTDAQTNIKLPSFLYQAASPTTKAIIQGNLNSQRKSENLSVTLDLASYTATTDNTKKTISISGNVKNSPNVLNFKKGDAVAVKVEDANGKFIDITAWPDENGNWSINDYSLDYMDMASVKVASATLATSQEVANKQKISAELVGANGEQNILNINFTKQLPQASNATSWDAIATITDQSGSVIATQAGTLVFDENSHLVSTTLSSVGGVALDFGGTGDGSVYDGLRSSVSSGMTNVKTDGYLEGILKEYAMDANSTIVAQMSNGNTFEVAKLGIYHFINDQGLAKIGDNTFTRTVNSGNPYFHTNAAGEYVYGVKLRSSMLEMSNVDLGTALTEVIVTQKAYDASSKSITTSDEMIQTAIQMKK
ncbi:MULTISPECIES: flagellar hook-basal body complex protein [unclassified Campylobacter]|uniref:flagellar hook-basal body complex protein n=1 Tax=unclassified Campylobacter TaxID=2593542 RepID=UPI003D357AD6